METSIKDALRYIVKSKRVTLPVFQNHFGFNYQEALSCVDILSSNDKVEFDLDNMMIKPCSTQNELSINDRSLLVNVTNISELDYEILLALHYQLKGIALDEIKYRIRVPASQVEIDDSVKKLLEIKAISKSDTKLVCDVSRFAMNALYVRLSKLGVIMDKNKILDLCSIYNANRAKYKKIYKNMKEKCEIEGGRNKLCVVDISKVERKILKDAKEKSLKPNLMSEGDYYNLIKAEQEECFKNHIMSKAINEEFIVKQFPTRGVLHDKKLVELYKSLAGYKLTRPLDGAIAVSINNSYIEDLTLYIESYEDQAYIFDDKATLNKIFEKQEANSRVWGYIYKMKDFFPNIGIEKGSIYGVCKITTTSVVKLINDMQFFIGQLLASSTIADIIDEKVEPLRTLKNSDSLFDQLDLLPF